MIYRSEYKLDCQRTRIGREILQCEVIVLSPECILKYQITRPFLAFLSARIHGHVTSCVNKIIQIAW
jgi:hypothetical protein